jgi:hypothetical protein
MTVGVELRRIWNEAIIDYLEEVSQNLSGGKEEIHDKPH